MFRNYVTVAFRNLWKNKAYSFLNIAGLAVGMACSILILFWVEDEKSYDTFHTDATDIYYIRENQTYEGGKIFTFGSTPGPLAEGLKQDFPEVVESVRLNWGSDVLFAYGDKRFREEGKYADPALFNVFSFPVLKGDVKSALNDIHSVVITRKLAEKYFGTEDPIGKVMRLDNKEDYKVTAVLEDLPQNSTLQFDFLLPFENYLSENKWLKDWGNNGLQTFLKLRPGASAEALNQKIAGYIKKHNEDSNVELLLQPLTEIRLYSEYKDGKNVGGRISYVRLFAVVALFILAIACINFMNLSTARSEKRSKEVGVRKVMGAVRGLLIRQFLGESLLMAVLALFLALVLVSVVMPFFNEIAGKELVLNWFDGRHWLLFAAITAFTGILAGSYPALFLSAFNPVQVLKGTVKTGKAAVRFRQVLVVGQFFFSILLIIATIIVFQQINYLRNRPLGYDKENLMMVRMQGNMPDSYENIKQNLLQIGGVGSVTKASQSMFEVNNNTGGVDWPGKPEGMSTLFGIVQADYDFTNTFGMQLKDGRDFSRDRGTDSLAVLINEESARRMGMKDPVGKMLELHDKSYTIIGVLKDFHYNSVYSPIEPLIIQLAPYAHYMFIRIGKNVKLPATVSSVEGVLRKFNPAYPFEYRFLDDELEKSFKSEQQLGQLAAWFAGLAVLISCLGLFGLAMFTAEQRRKEIGVRKVLGASVSGVVMLLAKEFLKLVLVAFLIAVPVAWYVALEWLQSFAYRIDVTWWVFAITGSVAHFIGLLTVSFQSLRAALAKPVKSLRTE
jgi:predicted permease